MVTKTGTGVAQELNFVVVWFLQQITGWWGELTLTRTGLGDNTHKLQPSVHRPAGKIFLADVCWSIFWLLKYFQWSKKMENKCKTSGVTWWAPCVGLATSWPQSAYQSQSQTHKSVEEKLRSCLGTEPSLARSPWRGEGEDWSLQRRQWLHQMVSCLANWAGKDWADRDNKNDI